MLHLAAGMPLGITPGLVMQRLLTGQPPAVSPLHRMRSVQRVQII